MQNYSETSMVFNQEMFQNSSRAVHAGDPREGFFLMFRAVLCIQVLIQFRSVKPKCSSGRGYIYSMEGANFLT